MKKSQRMLICFSLAGFMVYPSFSNAHEPHVVPLIGDQPVLFQHTPQQALANATPPYDSFDFINNIGFGLFLLPHNRLDGLGRPATTGHAVPTRRKPHSDPAEMMSRLSGVDTVSCVGCHAAPNIGGAGDFATNNFEGAEFRGEPTNKIKKRFNERNTLAIQGAGPMELLGREMTGELIAIREQAIALAQSGGTPVTQALVAKTVSFGSITAYPNGDVDTQSIEGVDVDLVIKPFGRKGTTRSIREFTVTGLNRHHGLQAVERFGVEQTGARDFDQDGVDDELSIGDITALVVFQAQLETPVRQAPQNPAAQRAALEGESLFDNIECTSCHIPSLTLNNTEFCEPYARNMDGTFSDTSQSYCFDLATTGAQPRIGTDANGVAQISAFTDLKRHTICDENKPHFCNERTVERGVPVDQFLTRKLWDTGLGSVLHGHRGDLTTISDAILAHGGEANVSRERYEELTTLQQASIVEFLKTLRIPIVAPPPLQLPIGLPPATLTAR